MARFEVSADELVLFDSVLRSGLNAKQMTDEFSRVNQRYQFAVNCTTVPPAAESGHCGPIKFTGGVVGWRSGRLTG